MRFETFIGHDGVPVVQIDTEDTEGRIRVNLNDAPIWDADPERPNTADDYTSTVYLCRYCGAAIPGEASSRPCPASPDRNHYRSKVWNPPSADIDNGADDEQIGLTADRSAVDAIAALLGTPADWSSPADFLDDVAEIIARVRPHPGNTDSQGYASAFRAATGRSVPARWNYTPDEPNDEPARASWSAGDVAVFRTVAELDTELRSRNGWNVTIDTVISEPDDAHDAEVLPMYRIRFADGHTAEAFDDELVRHNTTGEPA